MKVLIVSDVDLQGEGSGAEQVLAAHMGERGRERVREHFGLDRMIGALEMVYTGLIGA